MIEKRLLLSNLQHCYSDSIANDIFPDAKKKCGRENSVYFPKDRVQNHIFRNAMFKKFAPGDKPANHRFEEL